MSAYFKIQLYILTVCRQNIWDRWGSDLAEF